MKIADPSLKKIKATSNGVPRTSASSNQSPTVIDATPQNEKKRKREDVDQSDPKLQEFLGVMLPGSSANKIHNDAIEETDERPSKMAAVALAENESDDEYEVIPARRRKESRQEGGDTGIISSGESHVQHSDVQSHKMHVVEHGPQDAGDTATTERLQGSTPAAAASAAPTTDDDWLRSRTNRLLDLVDDNDVPPTIPSSPSRPAQVASAPAADENAIVREDGATPPEPMDTEEIPKTEPRDSEDETLVSIRKTSRLFVRNLPYSATDGDLRKHFEEYGSIEEVRTYHFLA